MIRLSKKFKTYSFSPAHAPAVTIDSGETLVVETEDARSGTINKPTDLLDRPHPEGMNPVTGPICVRGAEPGDALLVRVHEIVLAEKGFTAVKQKVGLLAERAERFATRIIEVQDGWAKFSDKLWFPVRPMIGTIGVAPASETIETAYPGPHGGNMDNNAVRPGCRLHLPVFAPGGLLSLGDVHASMGDGEISMVGFDIASEVRLTVEVVKGEGITRPWIETAGGAWVTTGDDLDTVTALRLASEEMVNLLMNKLSVSFEDAYMLATVRGDLSLCQCCSPGQFPVTARMSFEPLLSLEGRERR